MSGSSADKDTNAQEGTWDANESLEKAFAQLEADEDLDDEEGLDSSNEEEEDLGESDDDGESDEDDLDDDEEPEDDEDADESEEGDKPSEEKDIGFAKHPRFRQLNEQLKAAKTKAAQFEAVEVALASAGVSVDSLEEGLSVLRALKDPSRPGALDVLRPHLKALADMSGQGALDADIQAEVDSGDLSETRARELQALRARSTAREAASREDAKRQVVREAETAVGQLYREFETSDSDWGKKRDLTETKAQGKFAAFEARNGRRPTVQEGVVLIRMAKEEIDALLPKSRERKPESRPVSGGARTRPTGKTAPKTLDGLDDYLSVINENLGHRK